MRSRTIPLAQVLLCIAGPLSAEEPATVETGELASQVETEEPPARVVQGGAPLLHGQLGLSLEDAIKMGLENNLDVQVERYAPLIADYDQTIAWGAYDPTLFAEFGYSDSQLPNANVLFGTDESVNRSTDGFAGLRGVLPLLSTEYSAQFNGARATTNNALQALSPQFTSSWSVTLTQPLMRDLIWNQPWTQVRTSRLLLESSQEDFRTAVMDTVSSIEDAYWVLIAEDEARRVAKKSLETAKALLEQTETQYEVGVVSKVEVTEAQAGLSLREVNLIRAENRYRNQQDVLIDLVLGPGLRSNSTLEIMPTDKPAQFVPYSVDVPTAVEVAFENRPELVAAQREIERQRVQLRFARSQRLPELDGILSFGRNGLSGDQSPSFDPCRFVQDDPTTIPDERALCIANPPDPSQGGFGRTYDDWGDSEDFSARARLSIPFPNTSARSTVSKTKLQLARARTQKRRIEQSIVLQVRQAARNLLAAQEGIVAARAAETAAAEQLRAERIRLEYGESTPFDVLQREEDLVDRENELIEAFQAYRTSVTALDRAQGSILRNRNIRIAEVGALR